MNTTNEQEVRRRIFSKLARQAALDTMPPGYRCVTERCLPLSFGVKERLMILRGNKVEVQVRLALNENDDALVLYQAKVKGMK